MTKQTNIQELSEDELKKLDFGIGIDHSGSTENPSKVLKGKNLFEEMKEQVVQFSTLAAKYDDDGITLVAFSSRTSVYDGVTPQRVNDVFKEFRPGGSTNLGACIRDFTKKATASTKDMVAIIFTDGAASQPDDVVTAIKEAATTLGRPKIGFALVQVGDDADAKKFLEFLDDQLAAQGVPDVVTTVTEEDAEGLSIGQLCWLARNA